MNVIILAAGAGTRMRGLDFPKPLLPIRGVPIITHVMRAFKPGSKFFVAVNSKAHLLRDYLTMQGEFDVELVDVGMPTDEGAGPGTSLLKCLEMAQGPSYVTVSDGLFTLPEQEPEGNWLGVATINQAQYPHYCKLRNFHGLLQTWDKGHDSPDGKFDEYAWNAWTGVGFISDWQQAITNLKTAKINGERQCSPMWNTGHWDLVELPWIDLGTRELYTNHQTPDYSKPHALSVVTGDRFVKVFPSEEGASNFWRRSHVMDIFGPRNVHLLGRVVAYDLIDGESVYKKLKKQEFTPEDFKRMLEDFKNHLWKAGRGFVHGTINMRKFYEQKTLERVRTYLLDETIPSIIKQIDWSMFEDGVKGVVHGDLQFDNILIKNDQYKRPRVIDWRSGFGDDQTVYAADIYYDLGKLLSGIWLDIDRAKKEPGFSGPIKDHEAFMSVLRSFHRENNLNWEKTKIICATCYLSMAGIHTVEYADAFYEKGIEVLKQVFSE